jgi:hypothetical protein
MILLSDDIPMLAESHGEDSHRVFDKGKPIPPNYLRGFGGPAAIQRLIDSTESPNGGSYVYQPKAFSGSAAAFRRFPPFNTELDRKAVLHAVSVCIISYNRHCH